MDDLLNINTDDNIGGLLQLVQFAPVWFFSSLSPLAFNPGCSWINVYLTGETPIFSEQTSDDVNGGFQAISITGDLPKIRSAVHASLLKYRLHQCIVQCQDMNGNLRMAGTLNEPLVFSDRNTTGGQAADMNGYKLTWKGSCTRPAAFITQ